MNSQAPLSNPRQFLMKDLYTEGMDIALRRTVLSKYSTVDILRGYEVLDEGFDPETGEPRYDRHVWYALARMLLGVGDIGHAGVMVGVSRVADELPLAWDFSFDLPEAPDVFTSVRFTVAKKHDAEPKGFAVKAMGPATVAGYVTRFGAYPMSVQPALRDRSTSAVAYFIATQLHTAGLPVVEIYHPEDTAANFARYYLSDGIMHCEIDVYGPRLVKALAFIDRMVGRTVEDGALVDDLTPTPTEPSADTTDLQADNPALPS